MHYYLSLAIKGARRTPWLTVLMVGTLAIGLAAGMVTITLRHALGMDPVPDRSARLFNLQIPVNPQNPAAQYGVGGLFGYAMAGMLSNAAGRHAEAAISGLGIVDSVRLPGDPRVIGSGVGVRYATRSFFHVFDVPLKAGRLWTPQEAASAAPVVVLGEDMARHLFPAGDAIGRLVLLGAATYRVIGIAALWNPQPRYYDLHSPVGAFGGGGEGMFVPLASASHAPDDVVVIRACPSMTSLSSPMPEQLISSCRWLTVWYLVHESENIGAVRAQLGRVLPNLFHGQDAGELTLLDVRQLLIKAEVVPGNVRLYAWLGATFLLLSVVNVSGMQLSRVLRGTVQIGIRRALGASRAEILKQYLCDAMLTGAAGGVLGLGLTQLGLYGVRHFVEAFYAGMAKMDASMFGLMFALVVACSALMGLIPAWLASRADPALVIKSAS